MKFAFEWDVKKASANRKKHKVSFDEASSVFHNPSSLVWFDDEHSDREDRQLIIGRSIRVRVLMVSYTIRNFDIIRIISARLATRTESLVYEENEDYGAPV